MNQTYKKRIYNLRLLLKDTAYFTSNLPAVSRVLYSPSIDRSFAEKIMLTITSVNNCRYCTWLHSDLAGLTGVQNSEIENILQHSFEDVKEYEKPALIYALHYAETNRNPDSDLKNELFEFYGEKIAAEIEIYIRLIFFGNLSGNTMDAFISRLRGIPAIDSSPLFEAFFAAVSIVPLTGIAVFTNGGK